MRQQREPLRQNVSLIILDVVAWQDEISGNEEHIEHFHKKSVEIQEMLQSQEAPLELQVSPVDEALDKRATVTSPLSQCHLQVMETQLRKRMQHVKELFTDCTDVFEELVAVKTHLAQKIEECQSAVENIQGSLSQLDATQPQVETEIQVDPVEIRFLEVSASHSSSVRVILQIIPVRNALRLRLSL